MIKEVIVVEGRADEALHGEQERQHEQQHQVAPGHRRRHSGLPD